MEWKTDWGLRGRMGFTMFLLFALYVVFIGVLIEVFNVEIIFTLAMFGAFSFAQYFFSDKLALRSMGARKVSPEEYIGSAPTGRAPEPAGRSRSRPTVAVADTQVPNAFATGRNKKNATVAVTTGLLPSARRRRARRRARPRARAREEPRRDGDDHRVVPLDDRLLHRAVGMAVQRRQPAGRARHRRQSSCRSSSGSSRSCSFARCRGTASTRPTVARRSSRGSPARSPRR